MQVTAQYVQRGAPWQQMFDLTPEEPLVVSFHTPPGLLDGGKGGSVGFAADQPATGPITLLFQGVPRTDLASTSMSTGFPPHVLKPDTDYSFTISVAVAQRVLARIVMANEKPPKA